MRRQTTLSALLPPLLFCDRQTNTELSNSLGGALLRPLAWWWCATNFSADWLLNLAQVFGLPFRWANYDPNAPQATIDAICDMLQNMGSSGWAAFPAGTELELKNEGLRNGADTPQGDMLDRCDKQCDLLVLGQTLTTDTGGMGAGGGSLALGRVHAGVKAELVSAAVKFVADVFTEQLAPMILRVNYGDDEFCPTITLESEKEEDLTEKAEIIKTLVDAGAGKIIGLDWLAKTFAIPKPGDDEETLEAPEAPYSDRTLERQKEFYKYRKTYGAEKQPQVSDPVTSGEGVWRTINGARVFIEDGQSVEDAIAEMKRVSEENEDKLKQEKGLKKTPENDKLEHENERKSKTTRRQNQTDGSGYDSIFKKNETPAGTAAALHLRRDESANAETREALKECREDQVDVLYKLWQENPEWQKSPNPASQSMLRISMTW